jgi:hypothetical protein
MNADTIDRATVYDYMLANANERGRKYADLLNDLVRPADTVVDLNCGKLPVSRYLACKHLIANDILDNPNKVKVAAKVFEYHQIGDVEFAQVVPPMDVLLFTGICGGHHPIESKTERASLLAILSRKECNPRLIVLELSPEYFNNWEILDDLVGLCEAFGYQETFNGKFRFDWPDVGKRELRCLTKA